MNEKNYWQKQNPQLFQDLEWSKPEQASKRGKLLVVGGNIHDFTDISYSYNKLKQSGIGDAKVVVPASLKKFLGNTSDIFYADDTSTGSFASTALDRPQVLQLINWAELIVMPGQLGRNSQTSIFIEKILDSATPCILTKDAISYLFVGSKESLSRPNLILVVSLSQLQKLVKTVKYTSPITFGMSSSALAELLHLFTKDYPVKIITAHHQQLFVASMGQVYSTKISAYNDVLWQLDMTLATAANIGFYKFDHVFEAMALATRDLAKK